MESGVTVKIYGLEDIRKQATVVREKMRELNRELGKLDRALCMEAEINQPPEKTEPVNERPREAAWELQKLTRQRRLKR